MSLPIIALLTDFGEKDPYVGAMKGVILSICPQATIVDISHGVSKFNICEGAFILASTAPYFPRGTIYLAVVDPGVGTEERRAMVVETKRGLYVGPDNGLLMLACIRDGIRDVYHITNKKYMLPRISRTFHGRDVFAPVVAHLARGIKASEVGPRISDYKVPKFAKPVLERGTLFGEVIYIDSFGNVVSNISERLLRKRGIAEGMPLRAKIGKETLSLRLCGAYAQVPIGAPLAIIGSTDFLELSINQGNMAERFKIKVGDALRISKERDL